MTSKVTPQSKSDFWGKGGGIVPFIGQVEDVNDPNQSGRVKVRCVGWHPKEKKEMPTEDLPWAHVGMPTTHAQTARIGGKHGLLNGSWVMGIFLDEGEAQRPFVMNTFNFVANSTTKDNKVETTGEDGTDSEDDIAFRNTMASPKTQPNQALRTSKEAEKGYGDPNDMAGNTVNTNADHPCGGKAAMRSIHNEKTQEDELNKNDNPTSNIATVKNADGMCGDTPHATQDIQQRMEEMMPGMAERFIYGDLVWSNFSGAYIDLNGIMAQLAIIICNLMKGNINATKAIMNELNRIIHSQVIAPGGLSMAREFSVVEARDVTISDTHDIFNTLIQKLIDMLCELIMGMLQGINNNNNYSSGSNPGGNTGTDPSTRIQNAGDICVASTVVNNLATITEQWMEMSSEAAESAASNMRFSIPDVTVPDVGSILQFFLNQQYTKKRMFHNVAGVLSQDFLTREGGCRQDRQYNTETGYMASAMGNISASMGAISSASNGGGSGGSSGGGSGGDVNFSTVGFGGLNSRSLTGTTSSAVCDDATTPVIPDPGFDTDPGEEDVIEPELEITPINPGGEDGDPGTPDVPTPEDPFEPQIPGDDEGDPETPGGGDPETPGGGDPETPGGGLETPGGGTITPGTPVRPGIPNEPILPGRPEGAGPGKPGGPCGPGESCPPGHTCVDGICVPGTSCGPGNNCPDGFVCIDGICVPESPIRCDSNGKCPIGHYCSDGICIPNGTTLLDPGGTEGTTYWIAKCEDGKAFVSSNGIRARSGDCYVVATDQVVLPSDIVTAGGDGGSLITINGTPLVAGGVGGTPVFAGQYQLSTSYGVPVFVGGKGGIPLKAGANSPDSKTRITLGTTKKGNIEVRTRPAGNNASAIAVGLPSEDKRAAKNFIQGTPNQVVIIRKGKKYFFNNKRNDKLAFPSIFIPGYQGRPVPVVDRLSGEMVAVLTNYLAWNSNNPNPPVSIMPDDNNIGIVTDDPTYDIVLSGFYIGNTGFNYRKPMIQILDRDTNTNKNAVVELITQNGRIVDYNIINSGTGFLRIPRVKVYEGNPNADRTVSGGYGARLYPIMSVIPRDDPSQPAKPELPPVHYVYCPSKGQRNLY